MDEDVIELDMTQIGSNTSRHVKIVNPSEQPIYVSLFLSFEPLGSTFDFELNAKSQENVDSESRMSANNKDQYF